MPQPLRSRDLDDFSDREIVEYLEATPDLTQWEAEFAASILRWVNSGKRLTTKQRKAAFRVLRATRGVE